MKGRRREGTGRPPLPLLLGLLLLALLGLAAAFIPVSPPPPAVPAAALRHASISNGRGVLWAVAKGKGAAVARGPSRVGLKTGKEINQAILAREMDAEGLLDLILQDEGPWLCVVDDFDAINCATFINRLSKSAAAHRREKRPRAQQQAFEARLSKGVGMVLDRATALLPMSSARQLANVVNGLGKLHHLPSPPAAFFHALAEQARKELPHFLPQELSNMLHGLAILPLPPRPPRTNHKGSSKPREREETAPAVSTKAKDGEREQTAGGREGEAKGDGKRQHKAEGEQEEEEAAASAAFVWAEMDSLVDLLVGEALPSLLTRVEQGAVNNQQERMGSQHVGNILFALGRLNHQRHPPALTSLLQHITAPASRVFFPPSGRTPLPHFPQHMANALNGLARLREGQKQGQGKRGRTREEPSSSSQQRSETEAAVAAFVERCVETCLSSGFALFRARDLSATLNSLLRLGFHEPPPGFLPAARGRCYAVMDETNAQDIALLLNALSRFHGNDQEVDEETEALVVAMLHRLLYDLPEGEKGIALTPQGVAMTINAAAKLLPETADHTINFETLEEKRRLYRPLMLRACALLPKMDAQGMALTILGLGRLSEGAAGTREPIASTFLSTSSPTLPSFGPRHLSAAMHGLALFCRPPPVAYWDTVRSVALPRLPEFTAQQLVLTLHSMAQLGYHPGATFLDAWATALCTQLHQAQEEQGGKEGQGRNTRKQQQQQQQQRLHHRSLLEEEEEEGGTHVQDPLQNLSLAFVALAILQSPPPQCLWTEALALLHLPPTTTKAAAGGGIDHAAAYADDDRPPPTPEKHRRTDNTTAAKQQQPQPQSLLPLPTSPSNAKQSLRLIDAASLLWSLAALNFPSECPPPLMAALVASLPSLLPAVTEREGVAVDKQAASQLKQFAMAADLLSSSSSTPVIDASTKALIEERAWLPFDNSRHRRRTREERARAALMDKEEDGSKLERDEIITSPVQLEVESLLCEMGLPHEAEVEFGPYTLDVLVQTPAAHEKKGEQAAPVVVEVDGASHFFANLETEQGSQAPRGQTALKRRVLQALVQRGVFGGAIYITTDEWAAAEKDGEAEKRALLQAKLEATWGATRV